MSVILAVFGILWLVVGYITGRIMVAITDDGPVPTGWLYKTGVFLAGFLGCWLIVLCIVGIVLLIAQDHQTVEVSCARRRT